MKAFVVVGMGYGDEGKGSTVDWLTREFDTPLVVRFNGGAQAAHHVVTPEGQEHTFHTFGSGTLAGAQTYLAPEVLVDPLAIAIEAAELMDLGIEDPFRKLWINEHCPVTTPYHVALNRLKEMSRGDARHGSCGMGIGETMEDVTKRPHEVIRWIDVFQGKYIESRLQDVRRIKLKEAHHMPYGGTMEWDKQFRILEGKEDDAIVETFRIVGKAVHTSLGMPSHPQAIFEGAQGILIDQRYGAAPYHTWSDCTPHNAMEEIKRLGIRVDTTILGVTRAYATRHGAGPFSTEWDDPQNYVRFDRTNPDNPWQGALRYGALDPLWLRYAAMACRDNGGLDGLVVTCLDQLLQDALLDETSITTDELPYILGYAAGAPLWATSHGPTAEDKKWLDNKLAVL